MRVATRPIEGDAAAWDPENPGPFEALAGSMFAGQDGDLGLVRTKGGCTMHIHPGWLVIRPDGTGDGEAIFTVPENLGDEDPCLFAPAG
jgi:hypothetical protein